jgi:hypothetical protein
MMEAFLTPWPQAVDVICAGMVVLVSVIAEPLILQLRTHRIAAELECNKKSEYQ